MRILLDSNAYTLMTRGNQAVLQIVSEAEEVLMSAIVMGELMHGFFYGARLEHNMGILRSFVDNSRVTTIDVTPVTADRYGRIAAALWAKGRPIPTNDMWIAAHAMETGAELISADHHFEQVDGLVWTRVGQG